MRLRTGVDRRHDPRHSHVRMLQVIDFLFNRVSMIESFEKIAQMGRFGDNIERNMATHQRPNALVPFPEDDLRHVGVRLLQPLQNFLPQFKRLVEVNQQDPCACDRQ